jgi:hypothetical protein
MQERAATPDAQASHAAARAAVVAPWQSALRDLTRWFDEHGGSIWQDAARPQAEQRVALLHDTLEALGRGDDAIGSSARARAAQASATAAPRIDALLAGKRVAKPATTPSPALAERRRKALLNLALWDALRGLQSSGAAPPLSPLSPLSRLHARLAEPAATAPGLSPALAYAQTAAAREFFEQSVRRVLQTLAARCGSDGQAYARLAPTQPFDAGLPSLVEWSQAWSAAVAGVYLDYLQRHSGDDVQRALFDLWAGQLDAVRFRAGAGLTALPAHAGSLHLDLWTCAVKAQALAFDAARWPQHAAGTCWHGVRIDMHELGHDARANHSSRAAAASGLGIETLYRVVFVDRLLAAMQGGAGPRRDGVVAIDGTATNAGEHTIAIEMERPRPGHLPNLKLLLRWRDPSAGPLRFAADDASMSPTQDQALQRWLAAQGQAGVARRLSPEAIDWRAGGATDADGAAAATLGNGAFWAALDEAVQWIDPALVVCCDDAWYELPVELRDDTDRTAWTLHADAALPAGLDRATLLQAVGAGALQWLATDAGLGVFVMAAIDVDAWRRAQRP